MVSSFAWTYLIQERAKKKTKSGVKRPARWRNEHKGLEEGLGPSGCKKFHGEFHEEGVQQAGREELNGSVM